MTNYCSVLAIESTTIKNNDVTVEAMVDDMRCISRATYSHPAEYAPALCIVTFQVDPDEQIPTDEDGFCRYLHSLNLEWQPVDTSDYDLD